MPDSDLPDRPPKRAELEAPYRHPFRTSAAATWRALPALRNQAILAALLIVGGGIGALAVSPVLWLTVGVGVLLAIVVALTLAWSTVGDGVALVRRARQRSELRSVLEARPHGGAQDPDVAHDLFAVTAEDDGWLYTWRFRALYLHEQPNEHEVEVPGRPRYAAEAVTESRFDAHDAARAAEQLVAAQDAAAAREAAAASAAYGGIEDASLRADLAIEARTTAAALQRATGQDARRGGRGRGGRRRER